MILWITQKNWYNSMAFGIPLSASRYITDNLNQTVKISDCLFFDKNYEKPMTAILCQATRVDGNIFESKHLVGQITNESVKTNIQNKLFAWLFES